MNGSLKMNVLVLMLVAIGSATACSDDASTAPPTPDLEGGEDAGDVGGGEPIDDASGEDDLDAQAPIDDVQEPEGDAGPGEDVGDEPQMDAEVDPGGDDAGPPTDPGGECDPFAQDCPPEDDVAQVCIPVDGTPTCIREPPDAVGEDGECVGGDCQAGLTCINWSDARGQICTRMCPRVGGEEFCGEEKVCAGFIRSNPAIGLCQPPASTCDIYAQDCPEGEACTFGRDSETDEPIFVCENAGPNAEGDPCSGGNGRCQAGLICIRDDETTSTCHAICQSDDECTIDGQACAGRSSTWQVTFCR